MLVKKEHAQRILKFCKGERAQWYINTETISAT